MNQNALSLEQEKTIKHKAIWNTSESLWSESMRIWVSIPLYHVDIVLLCPKCASLCYGCHKHFRNTQGDYPKSSFLGCILDLENLDIHRGAQGSLLNKVPRWSQWSVRYEGPCNMRAISEELWPRRGLARERMSVEGWREQRALLNSLCSPFIPISPPVPHKLGDIQ